MKSLMGLDKNYSTNIEVIEITHSLYLSNKIDFRDKYQLLWWFRLQHPDISAKSFITQI